MKGWLISRDETVTEIRDGFPVHDSLLPLYFKLPGSTLKKWLHMPPVDTGRNNSRLLRKRIGLSDAETGEQVLSAPLRSPTFTGSGVREMLPR